TATVTGRGTSRVDAQRGVGTSGGHQRGPQLAISGDFLMATDTTTRATVEEALRRAADGAEDEREERAARQGRYFDGLAARVDIAVLRSDEMWR
ncbi:MAG: hypothetical protein AB1673_16795, partial [Actinomycetota bacterium]